MNNVKLMLIHFCFLFYHFADEIVVLNSFSVFCRKIMIGRDIFRKIMNSDQNTEVAILHRCGF